MVALASSLERPIQVELYRVFAGVIKKKFSFNGIDNNQIAFFLL